MGYSRDAQKRYAAKKINFAIAYTPVDIDDGKRLKKYLSDSGLTANAYIKSLIKADLDKKGIAYDTPEKDTE